MTRLLSIVSTVTFLALLPACKGQNSPSTTEDTAKSDINTNATSNTTTPGNKPSSKKQAKAQPKPGIDVSAPPKDATTSAAGITTKILSAGTGASPQSNDTVKIHFDAWRPDGKLLHSTKRQRRPQPMMLGRANAGWKEILTPMKVGQKTAIWASEELLGRRPAKGKASETVVLELELVEVIRAPPTPTHLVTAAPGAKKLGKDMRSLVVTKGQGNKKPETTDSAEFHLAGWDKDGTLFENTAAFGRPRNGDISKQPVGIQQALATMTEGETRRVWLAEGVSRQSYVPKGPLVYDITLARIIEKQAPPKTPKDVAKPPKGAQKTASGVSYKFLKRGKGTIKPTADQKVQVHYSGWTTDGKMFDSSVTRGQPAEFGLRQVIKGWTDGLQVMSVGDKTRFWIPQALAYQGRPGKPKGMLVFDVELLAIR